MQESRVISPEDLGDASHMHLGPICHTAVVTTPTRSTQGTRSTAFRGHGTQYSRSMARSIQGIGNVVFSEKGTQTSGNMDGSVRVTRHKVSSEHGMRKRRSKMRTQ